MRRTKEQMLKTKDSILDAAVSLFSENGVANTSLEEIAQAANVTRGAIYWHFKNKAEIFDALNDRLYLPLTEMILQDIEQDHPHPLVQMQDLCIQLLLDIEENDQKRQAISLFMSTQYYVGDLEYLRDKHKKKKEESLLLFQHYFDKAKAQGLIPETADTALLTLSIRCYTKGIILEYLNDHGQFSMKDYAPKLMKLFFRQCDGV